MTIFVRYGRYGGDYTDEFESLEGAIHFIRVSEDHGEIFASSIADADGLLWKSRHPLDRRGRWQKIRDDAPALPADL